MTNAADATWVEVGRVGRPHGRDGSFVVERASEASRRFEEGAELFLDRAPVHVVESKRAGGRVVIRLDVEARRGAQLELPRSALLSPGKDAFYVFQLVGLRVESDDGRHLGTITDVVPGPANDVIELDNGVLLPLVRACVLEVDEDSGRVVVARSFASDG